MRTSRFLTRLARHHSSALTSLSPPATSLLRCSLLSEFCGTSATDDRPSFQFHSNTLLRHGGRGGGFFTSPFPYRGLVSRYCSSRRAISLASFSFDSFNRSFFTRAKEIKKIEVQHDHSQRAVTTALWCNLLVFSLKFGVWLGTSSHVMLAEVVHSVADFANQALLAYGLSSSRRAPDALHPYGYSKERFVWSLISAVGIFCLGSGATIVHGIQNLWTSQPPGNIQYAALVIGGSFLIEGASLVVAIHAVRKGAAAEGMTVRDYVWRGHDPTAVAVMTEVIFPILES
ncbi:hypothetical protein RHGRI_035446 [Rhododendron griersonianum]|uniref:Cation efflux protein transmembrane domain-containing protein n=1 Tax=Rhododendron griersonianum TaxID=479676 RepID=A0AAV6I773_9ERIC|nr:hypothetical protein RHGRI_035446 [Rhododendron griersonianum]